MNISERLEKARKEAGYERASEAARAYGWTPSTYISHENGTRGLKPEVAEKYAKAFRVPPQWLLYGSDLPKAKAPEAPIKTVPLLGYVAAGAKTYFFNEQQHLDEVPAPKNATESTVAVVIQGDSLGPIYNGWLVFYDDVHRPPNTSHLGQLCVVGLLDGRIMVKQVQKSRSKQGYHLISNTEAPILDVEIEWAAKVIEMRPR